MDLELAARLAERFSPKTILVAGRKLDRLHPANDLDHFFLADVRHPGTLGQSMVAQSIIEIVNTRFGAELKPLGDREIVNLAVQALSTPALHDRAARSKSARREKPPGSVLEPPRALIGR